MTREEIEAKALKLDPKARARLAERLLESLEGLSMEENAQIWAEEALRRDEDGDANSNSTRSSVDVFADARKRLK